MDAAATLRLFDEVALAVRGRVVRAASTEPGDRPGQYRLDVHADEAAVAILDGAGFGILSEESGRHRSDRAVCVVVDPVDGSTNAGRGLPCWATSLCAVDADGPWVATVVDHTRDVTYRAVRGGGATRAMGGGAPAPIRVASPVAIEDAIVAVNGWSPVRPSTAQYRALGAAAIELCLVAEGALDGYVNLDGDSHGSWDYLGAVLVLREAGGAAADRWGRELTTLEHTDRRCVVAAADTSAVAALVDAMMSP